MGVDSGQAIRPAMAAAPVIAIVIFITAVFVGSISAALGKLLSADLPIVQIVWCRFAIFFFLVLILAVPLHGREQVWFSLSPLQTLRGLLLVGAALCFIAAVSGMSLAPAMALVFIYPFLISALAPAILGERTNVAGWIATVIGFGGVLLVMRPSPYNVDWHAFFAVAAGMCFGGHLLVTRRLGVKAPPLVTATLTALIGCVVLGAFVPFFWQPIDASTAALLVSLGLTAAVSQLLTIVACRRAEMSLLAPFGFMEIVAGVILGFILFGEFLDLLTWLGIGVIVASGIYVTTSASARRLPFVSRSRPPVN
jgi:drug/metabolite transporter (DMT)-like permease